MISLLSSIGASLGQFATNKKIKGVKAKEKQPHKLYEINDTIQKLVI